MTHDPLRSLLRHIALGTPLVLGPAGLVVAPGLLGCGSCPPSEVVGARYAVTPEDRSSGGETLSCEAICDQRGSDRSAGCAIENDTVTCMSRTHVSCGAGRLPLARTDRRATTGGAVRRRWLLETASLELAAVSAFDELARALDVHGAPRALVRGARRAAHDEVRHARALVRLAGASGPARVEIRLAPSETPTLFALALHNAREGCVNEALGALDAAHQAIHAPDAALRTAMSAIARDEARHALLSLALDAWARTRLSARERRAMDETRREAAHVLAAMDEEIAEVGLCDRPMRAQLLLAA